MKNFTSQWTIREIENLYINENYSMELVSKVTKIKLATLSRILWKYGLPEKKRERYGTSYAEVNRLPEPGKGLLGASTRDSEDDILEDFFNGL